MAIYERLYHRGFSYVERVRSLYRVKRSRREMLQHFQSNAKFLLFFDNRPLISTLPSGKTHTSCCILPLFGRSEVCRLLSNFNLPLTVSSNDLLLDFVDPSTALFAFRFASRDFGLETESKAASRMQSAIVNSLRRPCAFLPADEAIASIAKSGGEERTELEALLSKVKNTLATFSWMSTHQHCSACGCPIRRFWFRPTGFCSGCEKPLLSLDVTDVECVVSDAEHENCLLIRRFTYKPGIFKNPGSISEFGETPEIASRRVVAQTLGIDLKSVCYSGIANFWYAESDIGKTILGCFGTVKSITANQVELLHSSKFNIVEAKWFSRSAVAEILDQSDVSLSSLTKSEAESSCDDSSNPETAIRIHEDAKMSRELLRRWLESETVSRNMAFIRSDQSKTDDDDKDDDVSTTRRNDSYVDAVRAFDELASSEQQTHLEFLGKRSRFLLFLNGRPLIRHIVEHSRENEPPAESVSLAFLRRRELLEMCNKHNLGFYAHKALLVGTMPRLVDESEPASTSTADDEDAKQQWHAVFAYDLTTTDAGFVGKPEKVAELETSLVQFFSKTSAVKFVNIDHTEAAMSSLAESHLVSRAYVLQKYMRDLKHCTTCGSEVKKSIFLPTAVCQRCGGTIIPDLKPPARTQVVCLVSSRDRSLCLADAESSNHSFLQTTSFLGETPEEAVRRCVALRTGLDVVEVLPTGLASYALSPQETSGRVVISYFAFVDDLQQSQISPSKSFRWFSRNEMLELYVKAQSKPHSAATSLDKTFSKAKSPPRDAKTANGSSGQIISSDSINSLRLLQSWLQEGAA